jgi:hypothetical protein
LTSTTPTLIVLSQLLTSEVRMAIVLYGPTILGAIARGELREMKQLAAQADRQLRRTGDLRASYEILKVEIAKLEATRRGRRKRSS